MKQDYLKIDLKIILEYDYYKQLLSVKQQLYFESYTHQDFTLQEIADKYQISKSAVADNIKHTIAKIHKYEACLKLFALNEKRQEIYEQYPHSEVVIKLKQVEDSFND